MSVLASHRGFTLTELLVVIAIVGLLTALLLPSIKLVQAQARQSDCGNRMRQMGMASVAYQTDWEGWLPSSAMIGGGTALQSGGTVGLETYFGYNTRTELQASRAVRCPEMQRLLSQAKITNGGATDLFASNRNIWWFYDNAGVLNNGSGSVLPIASHAQIK